MMSGHHLYGLEVCFANGTKILVWFFLLVLMYLWETNNAWERFDFKGIANEEERAWPGSEPVIARTHACVVVGGGFFVH